MNVLPGTEEQLITLVNSGLFSPAEIEALCLDEGLSAVEGFDIVALCLAHGCLEGKLSWQAGDAAVTQLFGWAYREHGPGLSNFAWLVYGAFVVGEERHSGQPVNAGAEYFSLPLLELACRKSPALPELLWH